MLVGTVSKIGRKYMFIDTGNKALRFDGTTFSFAPAETDAYDTKYILFRSEEDYAGQLLLTMSGAWGTRVGGYPTT